MVKKQNFTIVGQIRKDLIISFDVVFCYKISLNKLIEWLDIKV